jgi:FMN phosphatase YigB (HAD superfamily)
VSNRPERILITDADNTLWDVDQLYALAQLQLLNSIEALLGFATTDGRQLEAVRYIDQRIARKHPMSLNYPVTLLIDALVRCVSGDKPDDAVEGALSCENGSTRAPGISEAQVSDLLAQFGSQLAAPPKLRCGVGNTVRRLKEQSIPVIVLTEGSKHRIEATLRLHGLESLVSDIVFQKKTERTYQNIAVHWHVEPTETFVVGDQLDVDVDIPKRVGCRTIWFPCSFRPFWTADYRVQPDFTVSNYDNVLSILTTRLITNSPTVLQ